MVMDCYFDGLMGGYLTLKLMDGFMVGIGP